MVATASQEEQEIHSTPQSQPSISRRRSVTYMVLVLTGTLLALTAVFPFAGTAYFNRVSRRIFWHAMDYRLNMPTQNCDVLIFGDSTAATGIDPSIIEQQTSLKTCNLALPYMALATTGTSVLDRYLKNNSPPRLIVFANNASHLRSPGLDEQWGVIDGWLLADRILPVRERVRLFVTHPRLSLSFAEAVLQQVFTLSPSLRLDPTMHSYLVDMEDLRKHHGYFALKIAEPAAEICARSMTDSYFDPTYEPTLRRRYQTSSTAILFYADPVRSCDTKLAKYREFAAALKIEPPAVYPVDRFADSWHLNKLGARENTQQVSTLINARLSSDGTPQAVDASAR